MEVKWNMVNKNDSCTYGISQEDILSGKWAVFQSKRMDIERQKLWARRMLSEADSIDWECWPKCNLSGKALEKEKLLYQSFFYETALIYYNIVVDLSLTFCFMSAKLLIENQTQDSDTIRSIDEVYDFLRSNEDKPAFPTKKYNPFKIMCEKCPEFQKPISIIEGFWDSFKESTIRKAYNFTKHRGKIAYNEIDSILGNRMDAIVQTEASISHIPIYSEDVGFKKSFREGISELKEFDESILTPYLFTLFNEVAAVLFHAKNNKSNSNHNIC